MLPLSAEQIVSVFKHEHVCRGEWPQAYWEDWMRLSEVRRDRQCIQPQMCRTINFGAAEANHSTSARRRWHSNIRLNDKYINWAWVNLEHLDMPR